MWTEQRWDLVIVGGGASGTLLAAQLLRNARGPLRVALLEKMGRVGPGLAYSTESPSHLLNVPAGGMSAFPDEPEHFLRWIRRVEPETGPGDFVQRRRTPSPSRRSSASSAFATGLPTRHAAAKVRATRILRDT